MMSVFRRKKGGKCIGNYAYKFNYLGETYKGSTGTKVKCEAEKIEAERKAELKANIKNRVNVNIQNRSLQNFGNTVLNNYKGASISVSDVWSTFKSVAPAKMKKLPSLHQWRRKETYWRDFEMFLQHREIFELREVTDKIALEYVSHLKIKGKYDKMVRQSYRSFKSSDAVLSGRTIGKYISQIKQVIECLREDAGMLKNPFAEIVAPTSEKVRRDVFEMTELRAIAHWIEKGAKFHGSSSQDNDHIILEALFIIGINTGLRKGDICLLEWESVSFDRGAISLVTRKTKTPVFIPMSEPLRVFLLKKRELGNESNYVVPELAELYEHDSDKIAQRFKLMLDDLGIKNQKKVGDRSRMVSSKDIHSLRHSNCYIHGMIGTPITLVREMIGHMDEQMTQHYTNHSTEEKKRVAISQMQNIGFLSFTHKSLISVNEQILIKARRLLDGCDDLEKLKRVVSLLERRP